MGVVLGSGEYRYEVIEGFGKLPSDWTFQEVAAVAVDDKDQVYCFTRGKHPVIVFDRDGNFLRSWGDGVFKRAHGATIGPDDTLFLTDDGDHTVRKCSLDGKILMTIGVPGKAAPYQGGEPFNRCTHVAFSPKGEIYVSDGYGNSRVHKYSPDGKLLLSWGESGSDPGQFNIVHNIVTDKEGWVYVADRENTESRFSTAMASTRASGTTCTGPVRFIWTRQRKIRSAISASWVPGWELTKTRPI